MKKVGCFGEILLRLSPPDQRLLEQADRLDIFVGGAEANVAASLAGFGRDARVISRLPDNPLGRLAVANLRARGVDVSAIAFAETGRLGLYFHVAGGGARGGEVIYDRRDSAFADATFENFQPEPALAGLSHLHMSGISLAVSRSACEATLAMAREARARNMTVSFDGNFRPALWAASGRDPRGAISEAVSLSDLFIGNHRDVSLLLEKEFSGDGEQRRREAAEAAFKAFPNLSMIASTARHIVDANHHRITGRMDWPTGSASTHDHEVTDIVDRIGTGDAFAAGIIHGWLDRPDAAEEALELAMGNMVLKHSMVGDTCLANEGRSRMVGRGYSDVLR